MYFNCHNHTEYSNLRLLDCINKPEDLINKAFEMGLNGIAITDHEALCAHMIVNKLAKKYQTEHPDFMNDYHEEIEYYYCKQRRIVIFFNSEFCFYFYIN